MSCYPPCLMGSSTECAQSVSPPHHTGHTGDTSHIWPQFWAPQDKKDIEVVREGNRASDVSRAQSEHLKGAGGRGPSLENRRIRGRCSHSLQLPDRRVQPSGHQPLLPDYKRQAKRKSGSNCTKRSLDWISEKILP